MKHVPTRSCIVCKEKKDKKSLIRIVKGDDDTLALDATGRAAGRGAYVCIDGDCMKTAIAKHAFNRAYKQPLPQRSYDSLAEEYAKLCDNGNQD